MKTSPAKRKVQQAETRNTEKLRYKVIGVDMKGVESSIKLVALGATQRLGRYGRGIDLCVKIWRPVHGSVS